MKLRYAVYVLVAGLLVLAGPYLAYMLMRFVFMLLLFGVVAVVGWLALRRRH